MMGKLFEVSELVRVAAEDEKAGIAFYTTLAEEAKSQDLRKTFEQMAEQEQFHYQRCQEMLASLGGHVEAETYPEEYNTYLHALTSDRAFPDETDARRQAKECQNDLAAVDLALRFERSTLVLLNEMRVLAPEQHRDIVVEITAEEQSHLVTLLEARTGLTG